MPKRFRFRGRDPLTQHVKPADRAHIVEARGLAALCGEPWREGQGPPAGWITRDELRRAQFPPAICERCHDVIWHIGNGQNEEEPGESDSEFIQRRLRRAMDLILPATEALRAAGYSIECEARDGDGRDHPDGRITLVVQIADLDALVDRSRERT